MENFVFDLTLLSYIILGVTGVLFLVQVYYWLFPYRKLYVSSKKFRGLPDDASYPPLSVILITKDSGGMLQRNLPEILRQDYPQFEVVVVDERSKGEDEDTVKLLQAEYPYLYRTFIPESARYISRRRLGLIVGLKAAKYDWVVLTEPSCKPVSKEWLKHLMVNATPQTDIILGYSNYERKRGYWNMRIVMEGVFHALRYLGSALRGKPYMGVGANMAFRKDTYFSRRDLSAHIHLKRGEDDLFVNTYATARNTQVAVSKESRVEMEQPQFHRLWYMDKVNTLVTEKYYKGWATWSNAVESVTAVGFKLSVIAGMVFFACTEAWLWFAVFAGLWLLRYILVTSVLALTAKALGEKLTWASCFFDWSRSWWSLQIKYKYFMRTKADYYKRNL